MNVRLFALMGAFIAALTAGAVEPFTGIFGNDECKVRLHINITDKNIIVPDQEIFGELDGYFSCDGCTTVWPIVSAEKLNGRGTKAEIEVINNYGSENFTATLTQIDDNTLLFEHRDGSTFKFPVNKKWLKVPSKIKLVRSNKK